MRETKAETHILSEQTILKLPNKKTKNKKIIPTLLLYNIIADQLLTTHFAIDELTEILLTPSQGNKYLGEYYMEIFANELPRGYKTEINEFLKLFTYANKEK